MEATQADVYYLPPSSQMLGVPNTTMSFPSQIGPGYINQTSQIHQLQQIQNSFPVKRISLEQPQIPNQRESYLSRDTCTICINSGTNIRLMPCSHQFHVNCLTTWLNRRKTCPNCNSHNVQALLQCNRCGNFN